MEYVTPMELNIGQTARCTNIVTEFSASSKAPANALRGCARSRFGARERGLSLVELMISLLLGAMVTMGVIQLFVANSKTHTLLVGQSRMQESARFALEFMGRAIRTAGYRGCYSGVDRLYSVPDVVTNPTFDPALTTINYEFNVLVPIVGYEGAGGGWIPAIDGDLPNSYPTEDENVHVLDTSGFGAGNGVDHETIQAGTDIVTLRGISSNSYLLAADMGSLVAPVVLVDDDPTEALDFDDDHLVVISDCDKSSVFRITGAPGRAGGTITLNHGVGDFDEPRNEVTNIHSTQRYMQVDSALAAIESKTFYIAASEGVNNDGNPVLSLWRKVGVNAPVELVEGVEDLQVLYGQDIDGDGVPNHYVTAQDIVSEIVTIRVAVVVNSVDNVDATSQPTQGCTITRRDPAGELEDVDVCIDGGAVDGLLRRSFTQTVMLRN